MFTGIIEAFGVVKEISNSGTNKTFWLHSALAAELRVDQSLAHDGVCLTVEEVHSDHYRVTAVAETLSKTALNDWKIGTLVNLERSLQPSSRLDGHFVQGHVDTTGICEKIKATDGSWEMTFSFPKAFADLVIEKGSICLNGISLTLFNVKKKRFSVALIPYTWEHTNLKGFQEGDAVNLEFDLIGKYINRRSNLRFS
ncbi:MAG: riboflavin synthase subunit alpha [Flaviaesturariibacter sp.]|nr:riboflavin synthase subunit alpha [Flaviaesturariibacter sp.]